MRYFDLKRQGDELKLRREICEAGRVLWQLGFAAASDGNVSVKLAEGLFLITPSGVSKRLLRPEMIVKINADGDIEGKTPGRRPSTEVKAHLRCYGERGDINAVVHAHPPVATGFAAAGLALDDRSLTEAVMFLGSVPVAPFAVPGTSEAARNAAALIKAHDAVLLANHGALTVGADLNRALYNMETLEHYAKVSLTARLLGGAKPLSPEEAKRCGKITT
ncbi:MAG: class II aldolase/adducin family protein [Oscillospiraceae bacterium]|nr:class II aldolase/adducin family protein [Oscillospiraceae bacterium]